MTHRRGAAALAILLAALPEVRYDAVIAALLPAEHPVRCMPRVYPGAREAIPAVNSLSLGTLITHEE